MLDVDSIPDRFQRHYGAHPRLIIRAPGRVNLIGEHTDYNSGFVLPVAIDRATYVAARPRDDDRVHIVAADLAAEDEFALDAIERSADHPWSDYVRGVAKGLLAAEHQLGGANMLIASDVPRGAGLSSSAALEVAVGYAFQLLNQLNILGEELALLAQGAENSFVGVQSGIMDQFIAVLGRAGHALLLDCRDLSYRLIPIPTTAAIVVCDSHVERTLAGSAYNQRRAECADALQLFKQWSPKITALRDITLDQFRLHEAELPDPLRARARHVVSENDRTVRGAAALEAGDAAAFGLLMNESHQSLRDDYQVSIPELDTLVEAARRVPGCYGSRLTGAGFGGCTVSLVEIPAVEQFQRDVAAAYRAATGRAATIYICRASDGVGRAALV
jgi:galactokinase